MQPRELAPWMLLQQALGGLAGGGVQSSGQRGTRPRADPVSCASLLSRWPDGGVQTQAQVSGNPGAEGPRGRAIGTGPKCPVAQWAWLGTWQAQTTMCGCTGCVLHKSMPSWVGGGCGGVSAPTPSIPNCAWSALCHLQEKDGQVTALGRYPLPPHRRARTPSLWLRWDLGKREENSRGPSSERCLSAEACGFSVTKGHTGDTTWELWVLGRAGGVSFGERQPHQQRALQHMQAFPRFSGTI